VKHNLVFFGECFYLLAGCLVTVFIV